MRALLRLVIAALAALFSAPVPLPAPQALAAVVVPAAAAASPVRMSLLRYDAYRVRPGDTLSQIAQKLCGHAIDWTGFYAANRGVIGGSPDLIVPGQVLRVACWDPPVRRTAARRATPGDREPDGDGDEAATARPAAVTYAGGYGAVLSFGQLEGLWARAGGPSWAEYRAARIAECESGGRVYAHNPSGASGLWQILGSVVPGNLYDPYVNALNAVAKFRGAGDTFAAWVCQ